MLRLNRYILGLVLWLAFLFNVERLDLGADQPDVFNIATPIYLAAIALVVFGLVVPLVRRVPMWQVQLAGVLAFGIAGAFARRPLVGNAYTYLSFFELVALLVTATLASKVGNLTEEFLEAARAIMFEDTDGRIMRSDAAEPLIRREMQFARRNNRSLTVMVLNTLQAGDAIDSQATTREVYQLLARRHSLVALTRLIARTLRRTDFVLDQTRQGRLVLVMPDMRPDQTSAIVRRLQQRAEQRLGVAVQYGAASFPEQGLTFEELVLRAEQSMHRLDGERSAGEAAGSVTQQLPAQIEGEQVSLEEPVGVR